MGCNSGKALPPGTYVAGPDPLPEGQPGKPERSNSPLLLGSEAQEVSPSLMRAGTMKASVAMMRASVSTQDSIETSASAGEQEIEAKQLQQPEREVEPNQVQEEPSDVQANQTTERPAVAHIPTAEEPQNALHSACHFSPLSIVGSWYYAHSRQGKLYQISIQGDSLQIEQVINNETPRGVLRADGEWLIAKVQNSRGVEIGSIRLRHESGKLISNFKEHGGGWGEELASTKADPAVTSYRHPSQMDDEITAELTAEPYTDRISPKAALTGVDIARAAAIVETEPEPLEAAGFLDCVLLDFSAEGKAIVEGRAPRREKRCCC